MKTPTSEPRNIAGEIEITPEMIEAGYQVILELCRLWDDHDESEMRLALPQVFLAMIEAAPGFHGAKPTSHLFDGIEIALERDVEAVISRSQRLKSLEDRLATLEVAIKTPF